MTIHLLVLAEGSFNGGRCGRGRQAFIAFPYFSLALMAESGCSYGDRAAAWLAWSAICNTTVVQVIPAPLEANTT